MIERSPDLDFAALLVELDALIGEQVVVEVAGGGHPVALEARGTLTHLTGCEVDFAGAPEAPTIVAFWLEGSGAWFSLRRAEIVSAHCYVVEAIDELEPARHVQVFLRGGLELIVGIDRLGELFDADGG